MNRKQRHLQSSIKIGDNLRRIRAKANMSQDDLAARIEVMVSQVRRYESGDAHISMPTMHDICQTLRCNYNDLFGGAV